MIPHTFFDKPDLPDFPEFWNPDAQEDDFD